jgi:hypothetical protein
MTRNEILKVMHQAHADFLAVIADIPDDVMATRPVIDWWTLKDLLGHIAMWYAVGLKFIREFQQDGVPKPLGFQDDAAIDAHNKREVALRRDWSLARVRAEFDAAFRDLVVAVEQLNDAQLRTQLPAPWPQTEPQPVTLERLIAVNTYEHLPEHTEQIRRWNQSRGYGHPVARAPA